MSITTAPAGTASSGEMDAATREVMVGRSLVVVLAVTPRRHTWREYAFAGGDRRR